MFSVWKKWDLVCWQIPPRSLPWTHSLRSGQALRMSVLMAPVYEFQYDKYFTFIKSEAWYAGRFLRFALLMTSFVKPCMIRICHLPRARRGMLADSSLRSEWQCHFPWDACHSEREAEESHWITALSVANRLNRNRLTPPNVIPALWPQLFPRALGNSG